MANEFVLEAIVISAWLDLQYKGPLQHVGGTVPCVFRVVHGVREYSGIVWQYKERARVVGNDESCACNVDAQVSARSKDTYPLIVCLGNFSLGSFLPLRLPLLALLGWVRIGGPTLNVAGSSIAVRCSLSPLAS